MTGAAIACPRCGHLNVVLAPIASQPLKSGRDRGHLAALLVAMLAVFLGAWVVREKADTRGPVSATVSPADALQQDLLRRNIDQAGDPALGARYQEIASRHFSGILLPIPVRWEPGLADVGSLARLSFTLRGMYGHIGSRSVILLNPELQRDARGLDRALCHEMVHAFLHLTGDPATDHGPAFQGVLQRLAVEGAFEGVPSTPGERAALRAWLDAEATRLHEERQDLERVGADLEREGAELARAVAEVGVTGQAEDAVHLEVRRESYNIRAAEANARTAKVAADMGQFNRDAARYNLMLAYPDGIDAGTHRDAITASGATP